jgi:hypothetical protein
MAGPMIRKTATERRGDGADGMVPILMVSCDPFRKASARLLESSGKPRAGSG